MTEQKIQERLLRLEREIGRILLNVDIVTDGLRETIHVICLSEGWDAGQYWILDGETQVMRYFSGWNIDVDGVREIIHDAHRFEFGKGSGLVGAVWESGDTLWIGDLGKEERLRRKDLTEITGWRQGLLFPVRHGSEIVGVLNFYAARIQKPDERILNFFHVVGALIGNYQHSLDVPQHCGPGCHRYQPCDAGRCISPRQFADPELSGQIKEALMETGLPPHLLELEVTESMVMYRAEESIRILTELKGLGVRISIDDFGTGYSTLSQLKQFPIDSLKVDRSFIRALPEDQEDQVLTKSIIAMAKTLGLTVIAEGVETEAQQQFLNDHACDELQGYFFSEAIPGDKVPELLNRPK